jgi:hypothetical protein
VKKAQQASIACFYRLAELIPTPICRDWRLRRRTTKYKSSVARLSPILFNWNFLGAPEIKSGKSILFLLSFLPFLLD